MDKLKKLYDVLVRDGYYTKSFDDFQNQYSDPSYQDKVFNVVTRDGLFTKSKEEFLTIYSPIQKKNQVGTPSTLKEVVTESVIEAETEPGSLVSADLAVDGDQYLETDIERLLEIETVPERTLTPGASARARAMAQQQREVDPELKRKFLSDFNISSAINAGIIDEEDLNSALRGNKGNIEKLKQLAVTSPDKYTQKILDKRLNKPFAFEESSDLVEFVTPEGEDEKKAAIRKKIIAYDAESKRLQDENPNATAEELSAILNRPDDPNFVTDEEYELVEDDFIPTGFEGSDVDNMYDIFFLKSVKGFNIKDFDGYLNEQGYKKEYLRLLEAGKFTYDGASFDFSKRYNPSLAAERVKLQYLTNYINNQIERNVEFQVLDYQSKNNGRHPSFDGVQLSFSSGVDDKQLTKYIQEKFPIMTSKLKQRDVKNEELYQSMKEGEIRGVGQAFKQGWRSVEDRINNFSAGTYDYIGLDNVADEIRMTQAETELEREDFMRYTYASGKEANVDGTNYLVDDKGQVYDTDLGLRVTDVLTPKELSSIKAVVENIGVKSSTFSTAGMIIQGTGIASDMLFQIALTRGVGNVGRGGAAFLGAFGRGKKVVDIMSAIPMKASTASAMVAQGTLFSTNLAEQSYKQALEGGLSIEQAEEIQSIAGAQGLALGVVTAPISTQTYAMDKIFGRGANDILVKGAIKAYEKAGAKGARAFWAKALQKAKTYALESSKEVVQENVQQVGQTYVIGENVNEYAKKEIMANTISGDDFINTTILSAAAGFFMPFAGDLSSGARTDFRDRFIPGAKAIDRLTALDILSKNVDKTTQLLNSQVTKGLYTEEQVKNILKDIDVYRKTINSIPPNLSPETALSIITDVQEIRKQEELKKQRDPAFHQDIDNKIKELRDGIVKKTNFDYLDNQTKIKLKDEALTELTKEAEDRGEKDFKINDSQATYRAIENFNKLSTQEKLDLAKIKKVTPEVEVTETQEVDIQSRINSAPKIFGKSHTDKKLPYGKAVISDITSPDSKGVQTAKYNNPQTGELDVIISSSGDSANFVGFTRVYENGKPTNQFTAKMESTGDAFKNMITQAENALPDGAEVIEVSTISIGGLKTYNKSKTLNEKVDSDGNVVTKTTKYSDATQQSVKEKGNEAAFSAFQTNDKAKAEAEVDKIKKAYPGIDVKIKRRGSKRGKKTYTIDVELPVLVKTKPEAAPEVSEEVTQVEYTAPDTRKQRRAEHELISIKEAEKRGLEVVEGQKWVAINKLTGRVVYAKSKGEAQSAIDNMDYDFGEGDLVNKKDLDELRGVKPEATPEATPEAVEEVFKDTPIDNAKKTLESVDADIKPRKQVADGDANLIESFANRIITQKGVTKFSEEALQFYAENQEAIDALVSQKRKGLPKDKSKERSLALKIARGDTDFSDADIDLYASSKENVQAEVEAIGRTRNKTITSDTYKSILAATKSTTRRDKAKLESENVQRKRFWASWNRSAREQKMSLAQKRKSLNDAVKAYAKNRKGTITTAQTRAVINKINTVNLDNPVQVKKVQEYVEKVFKNADFANDLSIAKKLTESATTRLNSGKLGDNGNFNAAVSQLVMLPLSDLDPSDLKNYNEFLKKIAKRNKKTKLDNELVKEANEILNSIKSKEIESESELQYDETKGFIYKEGTQKVINKILDPKVDGETIIEENSEFLENKLDALDSGTLEVLVEKVNIAENENNAEIVEQINDYAKNRFLKLFNSFKKSSKLSLDNLNKLTKDQSIGPRTLKNLNKGQLAMLTGTELDELDVHLDNINEGFYTYYANKIAQRVEANNRAINTNPVFDKMFTAKGKLSTVRQYISASVKNNLGKVGLPSSQAARRIGIRGQMIRSNPLSVIDQMFGNYKNNNVYDNIIRPTSEAHAKFQNWINKQTDILEAVESLLAPTLKESANAAVKRRFELTTYLLQKEFESNPNKKGVAPAIKFIEGTIDSYKSDKRSSRYNEESIAILESIAKQYSEEGQISLKKMDEAMSPKTKKALKMLEGIYSGLGELQAYATRIVRGNELDLVNNYVHHKAEYKGQERDDANFQNAINYLNIRPGTESKTSLKRVGATAIDFDPITTALRATRNTGMDYYMSNEISTTRQTLAVLKKMAVRDESKTEKQKDKQLEAVIDLDKIYSEALNNVVTNNVSSEVLGGKLLNSMRTIGYYATLASLPRAGAEYASNLAFAVLSAPSEITLGMTKYAGLSMSSTGRIIVENSASTVNTKLYSREALGGSKAETQGITRKRTAAKAKGKVKQSVEYVSRVTGVKYAPKVVDKIGESLVAKPDQMISRPLWFGTFAMEFKSQTGKRVNFDKIAENDSDYINEYKDAITAATKKADINVTRAATSNDPFSQVLKNQAQKGETAMNFYRMINGYMSSFSLNEYATARQAVASMAGQGQMGVIKGVTTLAGVGVRMSLYVTLLQYFNAAMFGFLGIGDDDDTDYEELGIRQAVGAATSLISRGVSGNVPMIPMNYALESLNKEYGYELGLRSKKEYDGFKHSLVYATINPSNASKNLEAATLFQLFGPFNPYAKTGTRIAKLALRAQTNKTEESRQANLNELFSERTAIEVANLFGGVPFYRDIRTGFLREQFKEDDQKGFSLDQLKILDPVEYNRIKELQKFEKQNMIKSQDKMILEAELKALIKELKQFK